MVAIPYVAGFHPWEDAEYQPEFAEKISELFAREEDGRPPYGQALDVGTGSGIWGIQLAKRGWQVTGVDLVPKGPAPGARPGREGWRRQNHPGHRSRDRGAGRPQQFPSSTRANPPPNIPAAIS